MVTREATASTVVVGRWCCSAVVASRPFGVVAGAAQVQGV